MPAWSPCTTASGSLPAKAKPLHDGIAQLRAGLGDKATADTLIYGVEQVRGGLAGATTTGGPLDQLKGGVDQSKAGVDGVKGGLDGALATPRVAWPSSRAEWTPSRRASTRLSQRERHRPLWGGVNVAKATAGCQATRLRRHGAKVVDGIIPAGQDHRRLGGLGQVGGGPTTAPASAASAYLGQVAVASARCRRAWRLKASSSDCRDGASPRSSAG